MTVENTATMTAEQKRARNLCESHYCANTAYASIRLNAFHCEHSSHEHYVCSFHAQAQNRYNTSFDNRCHA